jgi:XTP/dITP diphosphohydrolase
MSTERAKNNSESFPNATLKALEKLINIVAKLRSPEGGCPWDLAQTPVSLIPYIIEESYEVTHAIKSGNTNDICEELGDLLLQVILQAQIASENNQFSLADIAEGISEKLVRRHPHVFGKVTVNSVAEVHENWEQIKAQEKGEDHQSIKVAKKLEKYARQLPPLSAAMKISTKAASVGFEWDNVEGVWDKFHEEVQEFEESLQTDDVLHQQSELGDILFVVVNLARWYNLDPELALHETNERFLKRFSLLEDRCDRPLSEYSLEELENIWQKVKLYLAEQKNNK